MTETFRVACIQNSATPDVAHNLEETSGMVRAAAADGAAFVCLPEYFSCLDVSDDRIVAAAFPEDSHPALPLFSDLARELDVWLLLGSLAVRVGADKVRNRSYVLDPTGAVVARYDKLHLFDVALEDGESYRESATVEPGDRAVVAPTPWGLVGLSICYDLRFAYLYRALARAGARFLTVPAAFTRTTGRAHWHVLVRARAIETGSFVIAPCQCGDHGGGRASYGHSLIVDPWGRVLADGGEEPGHVIAEIEIARVDEARRMIPSLRHDRPFSGPEPATVLRAAEGS